MRNRGGCGDFARIVAEFEPPAQSGATEILFAVTDEQLPSEYLAPLKEGILEGLGGVSATVLVTHAVHHDVDSSDRAFRLAGWETARAALIAAGLLPESAAVELRWADWPGRPKPKRPKRRAHGSAEQRPPR